MTEEGAGNKARVRNIVRMRSSSLLNPNLQLTICPSIGIAKDRTGANVVTHTSREESVKGKVKMSTE